MLIVPSHRAALDPDRTLVVGNRGVGKSFWTGVLADPAARAHVARTFRELAAVDVDVGFNGSERTGSVAPTKNAIDQAFRDHGDADAVWRAVLVRAARAHNIPVPRAATPDGFTAQVAWAKDNGETVDRIVTKLDDQYVQEGRRLVIVFDALDRLGTNWETKRTQATALLKRALAVRSFRAIRLKLFMRRDQFEDPLLFRFADGSKIENQRVELVWKTHELYDLLFSWLEKHEVSAIAFGQLIASVRARSALSGVDQQVRLVNAIAGEFMGATRKQGRVYTWLPLHLSDARGETSPRTFLTAWLEAALREPAPVRRAIDHLGIHEGVRKASEDRLKELEEDYAWISLALRPLRGLQVPMDRAALKSTWRSKRTTSEILRDSSATNALPPVRLDSATAADRDREDALLEDLVAIGIVELRPNDKVNVPDIFRLEAGIKRKGGVPAPKRG
ncbi:MAG: hypothetical protein H7138_14405 [Myxococcales bacterium]|nr:hypothetical protein [Myxococcales bacterium]